MVMTIGQRQRLKAILDSMPADQPPRGHKPKWGPDGNVDRAFLLAAELGHQFPRRCASCQADLFDLLRELSKTPKA